MSATRDTGFLRNAVQVTNQGIVFVSGSTLLMSISSSGAVTTTGVISGSNALSSSYSISGSYTVSSSYAYTASSATNAFNSISASYAYTASSAINSYSASSAISSTNALTASSADNMNVRNSLTASNAVVNGTLTAQTLVVQTITASIEYSSGSNIFGSALTNTQTFTGSLNVTGSTHRILGNVGFGTTAINFPVDMWGGGGDQSLAAQTLQIKSVNGTSGQGTGIRISAVSGSKETVGILSVENTSATNGDMVFRLYNGGATMNEKVRITASGSVGIGITNPGATLQVGANTYINSGNIRMEGYPTSIMLGNGQGFYDDGNGGLNVSSSANLSLITNTSTRLYISSAGSVGIGTTNPVEKLHVANGNIVISYANNVNRQIQFHGGSGAYENARIECINNASYNDSGLLKFYTAKTSSGGLTLALTIDTDQTATFASSITSTGLTVARNVAGDPVDLRVRNNNTGGYPSSMALSIYGYAVSAGYYDQFRIQSSYPGYGVTSFLVKYQPNSAEVAAIKIRGEGLVRINDYISGMDGSAAQFQVNGFSRTQSITMHNSANTAQSVSLSCSGADTFYINGALSKNSGSFRIRHPLSSKKSTHQLVHSFIEGPKADLIYRGKIRLIAGRATVNMDEAATMTEGTFEALCREVQCFTSNESGWDLTKGTVEGNILTIESQNIESTEEISWLVIGERHDEHMMNTDWTDSNGRVIVEPLAPEENNIF